MDFRSTLIEILSTPNQELDVQVEAIVQAATEWRGHGPVTEAVILTAQALAKDMATTGRSIPLPYWLAQRVNALGNAVAVYNDRTSAR